MFSVPTFQQMHLTIVQEIRNKTSLTISTDSDASIRAEGTDALVEGLYQHQNHIQRQLFIQTADEPYLYIHAEELGLPRLGGTRASGTIQATSNIDLTVLAGTKVTDGKGHYWSVVADTQLKANVATVLSVNADQVGASWNFSGLTLLFVSPIAGLAGVVTVISISGGSDQEELEDWRARLLERKQLGKDRDRNTDLISKLKEITGIKHVYVYPKRRGLGSLDAAITAVGSPPTLPTQALIKTAQDFLDAEEAFWGDLRIYAPTEQFLNVTAVVSGGSSDLSSVETTIRDYFAELAPAEEYQSAVLTARIMALQYVTDVKLTPSSNVVPVVNWMYTNWIRLGSLAVSRA